MPDGREAEGEIERVVLWPAARAVLLKGRTEWDTGKVREIVALYIYSAGYDVVADAKREYHAASRS